MASNNQPNRPLPPLPRARSLIECWDGFPDSPFINLYELVRNLEWGTPMLAPGADKSRVVVFDGEVRGDKRIFAARFTTDADFSETSRILFRPHTKLEVVVKEHGAVRTHFEFFLNSDRSQFGVFSARIVSEDEMGLHSRVFGFPRSIDFPEMQEVVGQMLDTDGRDIFGRANGKVLAALLGIERAITFDEETRDPLSAEIGEIPNLEEIGSEIIEEIRSLAAGDQI